MQNFPRFWAQHYHRSKSSVDFLDVTLELKTGLHRPYMKPNNTIQYVHTSSNHPKHIINNIPKGVEKRLSLLSSNEEIFLSAAPPYQEALRRAGHLYVLKFNPTQTDPRPTKKSRSRRVLYYNPPFSISLKTKIGKKFFEILDRCFPPSNPLHKHFNRHTVKLSFSCMPNFGQVISGHNKGILKQTQPQQGLCNC